MQSGDLDSIDLDDPAAVKQALADAATRIRDLERDGVHAIGGVVAEMLDHAAKSGDEILDRARDDAQAIRAAAESAAADVIDQANATAEGIAAKAAADAIERSAQVITDAQQRLDRLLDAERDVHDRLQAALADIQASVLRVGVSPEPKKPFTIEDDPPSVVHETLWGDESSDEVSVRRRSA